MIQVEVKVGGPTPSPQSHGARLPFTFLVGMRQQGGGMVTCLLPSLFLKKHERRKKKRANKDNTT